jgi:hypothetical protein
MMRQWQGEGEEVWRGPWCAVEATPRYPGALAFHAPSGPNLTRTLTRACRQNCTRVLQQAAFLRAWPPPLTRRMCRGKPPACTHALLVAHFFPDPRLCSIHKYFLYNSRPVSLDGLMQLLTPDVIVDYPSGRFIGIDSYMSHQVCAPLCNRPRTSASFFAVCRLARPACCAAAARHLL